MANPKSPLVVAVGNFKGGTGKTTLTHHLAHATPPGMKVVIIDTDPQGGAYKRFDPRDDLPESGGVDAPYEWRKGSYAVWSPGAWLDPKHIAYDLVIVDTGASKELVKGPRVVDALLVVINGIEAARNANELVGSALDAGVQQVLLLRNNVDGGALVQKQMERLGRNLPDGVVLLDTEIPHGATMERTVATRRPIWQEPWQSKCGSQMLAACEEILARLRKLAA